MSRWFLHVFSTVRVLLTLFVICSKSKADLTSKAITAFLSDVISSHLVSMYGDANSVHFQN